MAYCANCGVELAASEPKCPLCGYVPEKKLHNYKKSDAIYPTRVKIMPHHISRKSIIALISAFLLLPFSLILLCDLSINCQLTWSGYALWAIAAVWLTAILPVATAGKRPILCVATACCAVLGYLFFIDSRTESEWALKFALPLIAIIFAMIAAPLLINRYIRLNGFSLACIIIISLGLLCVAVELLINNAFSLYEGLRWSLYPAISCTFIALVLSIINRSEPIKERLRKKFFI